MKLTSPLWLVLLLSLCLVDTAAGQSGQQNLMTSSHWTARDGNVRFFEHRGQPAMQTTKFGEQVLLNDVTFEDGTIEFDADLSGGGFTIYFRQDGSAAAEVVYLRTFRISNPSAQDLLQYAPITQGVLTWDLHGHYQAASDHVLDDWNRVKMVVHGKQMRFYLNNMEKPALYIPHLEADIAKGSISMEGGAIISNFSVEHDTVEGIPAFSESDLTNQDVRYLRQWEVTEPFTLPYGQELVSARKFTIESAYLPGDSTEWSTLEAERLGLVNLSRHFGDNPEKKAVWLKTTLFANQAQTRYLDFGFSDEAWVLLNRQLVYVDKNLYNNPIMKPPAGRISIDNDRFALPLQAGENELLVGVANDFWGWGIVARLDDATDVIHDTRVPLTYAHQMPRQLGDGWEIGTLEEVGMDQKLVASTIVDFAFANSANDMRSIIVARDGKLVVEQYLGTYREETVHDIRSAGKSVTGALVGVAVDQGIINDVDDPVMKYFDDDAELRRLGKGKGEITIEQVINMASGLHADADNPDSPGHEGKMIASEDFLKFVLGIPVVMSPGEQYVYNSANAYLAGAVIEKATGKTLSAFADDNLFGLLGITNYHWTKGPKGTTYAMGGLYMTGRDFAKIGALYLNDGAWDGKQVLSKKWVEATKKSKFELDIAGLQTGYSRLWLHGQRVVDGKTYNVYFASGNGGNTLAVVPALDMVVAIQQSAYGQGSAHYRSFAIIDRFIQACQ